MEEYGFSERTLVLLPSTHGRNRQATKGERATGSSGFVAVRLLYKLAIRVGEATCLCLASLVFCRI
jgi:hypothetical protein